MMRQAGRYLPEYARCASGREVFSTFALILNSLRKPLFSPSVGSVSMRNPVLDILVIPHALGQRVRYVEGEGPGSTRSTTPML